MKRLLGTFVILGIGLVLGVGLEKAVSAWQQVDARYDPVEPDGHYPARAPSVSAEGPASPVLLPGEYRFSGPYTHENLSLFLIHGAEQLADRNFLTLQEALEKELVVLHETGNVGELAIENLSPSAEVFVQSGDIVKGGKQDRVLQYDLVVGPMSGKVALASFCVEQGRWSPRGKENSRRFASSSEQLATKELKLAAKYKKNQGEVWSRVASAQNRLGSSVGSAVQSSESGSSLQLTLEAPKVQEAVDGYCRQLAPHLEDHPDAIGFVFAINARVNSAEVYGSHALFRKLWPKLLRASSVEAVAERRAGGDKPVLRVNAVRACLADGENGRPSVQTVGRRLEVVMQETERSLLFETREPECPGVWIHRTYLTK